MVCYMLQATLQTERPSDGREHSDDKLQHLFPGDSLFESFVDMHKDRKFYDK